MSTPTRSLRCHECSTSSIDIPGRTGGAALHSLAELASTKTLRMAGIAAAGKCAEAPSERRPPGPSYVSAEENEERRVEHRYSATESRILEVRCLHCTSGDRT